jgi:Stage II sporulation protein M
VADHLLVEASQYAFVHGVRRTRSTLAAWRAEPWPVLRMWFLGALAVAGLLLGALSVVALISRSSPGEGAPTAPPFVVGGPRDVVHILIANGLVLALHAMACVAGFIAGSSLPLQANRHTGRMRMLHERGPAVAIAFVMCATAFSLSMQAYTIGHTTAQDAASLHVSRMLLLFGVLPHALPELVALFLPLAAWILASRRGEWERLLAATLVTVSLALPILVAAAVWEVYVAPHLLAALLGTLPA